MLLDILGNIDQHRTGTVTGRVDECQPHRGRDPGDPVDQVGAFCDRLHYRNDVDLLKGVFAQQLGWHITGYRDNGGRITVGVSNTGHQVGGAGTGSCQADTDFAAGPGVTLSGVGCALLMLHTHATDTEVTQHIEYFKVGPTGIAKHHVHTFKLQAFGQNLGAPQRTFPLLRLNVAEIPTRNCGNILICDVVS